MPSTNDFWKNTWFLMPTWKWLALLAVIFFGIFLQRILKIFFAKIKVHPRFHSLHPFLHYFAGLPIESNLAWLSATLFWHETILALELHGGVERYLGNFVQLILWFYLIRLCYLTIDAFGSWLNDVAAKTENPLDYQLIPLATKTLKVFVIVFGFLLILQGFGFNVMSLLAGLGLGGLALALAAQDTAANVFGSITIILDRPFKVGDWIKVGDTEGHVEEIGFRSTRIRTFYQSLITVPNSMMAKEKIDNMGARPKRRIRHTVGLTYDTPVDKIQRYIDTIKFHLDQHNEIENGTTRVVFNQMGDFSLQILVQFFIFTNDPMEELELQQEILLDLIRLSKQVGVEFAFPTQTLMMPNLLPVESERKN
jgi:MscS family membrane protein